MKTFAFLAASGVIAATGAALASGPAADVPPGLPASAPVARIMAADASLRVDRGSGFEASGPVAMLRAGDVVVATSETRIVYGDGCAVQVASNVPMTALASSPCGDSAGVHRASMARSDQTGQDDGFNTILVLGGAALVVAVIALAGGDGDDSNPPFTP
ncbi:MAG: hypothetical protein ACK4E3_11925 [Brevundimonas sp.]|jgi:hypothetical protein|uniref:hypothetical protein n=1 Tax=Brevundimonas sp. TaxID=1871086 RepID=UPI00391DC986